MVNIRAVLREKVVTNCTHSLMIDMVVRVEYMKVGALEEFLGNADHAFGGPEVLHLDGAIFKLAIY